MNRLLNRIEPFAALFWALGIVLAHILELVTQPSFLASLNNGTVRQWKVGFNLTEEAMPHYLFPSRCTYSMHVGLAFLYCICNTHTTLRSCWFIVLLFRPNCDPMVIQYITISNWSSLKFLYYHTVYLLVQLSVALPYCVVCTCKAGFILLWHADYTLVRLSVFVPHRVPIDMAFCCFSTLCTY